MNKKEYRTITDILVSDNNVITGEIRYNVPSLDIGFTEVIAPTAFSKTITDGYDVRAYYNHDSSKVLGRVKNGSLVLENTDTALKFAVTVPDTQEGRDIYELVKAGYVTGVSFGFACISDKWELREGKEVRTVTEAKLYEITICSEPAYEQNTCQVRSLSAILEGKEIDEAGQTAIKAEIEKLQSLLPKEEEQKEPEPEAQEPSEEEVKAQEEAQKQAEEEAKKAEEEQKAIDELYERLEAAQKVICEAE